jgi:hypothetical protein
MRAIRLMMIVFCLGAVLVAQTNIQKPPSSLQSPVQRAPIATIFPKINSANPDCVGTASCHSMGLSGQNFGATRGSKRIFYDGVAQNDHLTWADTMIGFSCANVTFWPVHHTFYIDDGAGKKLSNTLDIVFLYKLDVAEPDSAAPGAEIKVFSWGCGPQAGKSLLMGTTLMTINFWPGGSDWEYFAPIRAVVPHLAPGTYPITMHSGAQVVSKNPLSFKVN